METQILHVDVNNAFLSWTAINKLKSGEDLDIRNIPAIIGGDESRRAGIVLAKSIKAKECGIVTGETIYMAKKKCPNLQVFIGNYKVYSYYSNKLYNLLLEYTDKIERYSIDECFLDMTDYLLNNTLIHKAYEISKRIKCELGFTVNIGISTNKLLAKMASDFTKPDRVHTLYKNEISTKMWPLPVSELFMLGKKTVPKLNGMKIRTIGDLATTDIHLLIKKFGKYGNLIWEYANGIDNSKVNYIQERSKSIGNSTTLPIDICNLTQIQEVILALIEQVTYRLRKKNLVAKTVCVQLRTKDFKDFSHQKKLDLATSNTKDIYIKVKELLSEMYIKGTFIRLICVRVDNLTDKDQSQISIFEDKNNKKQQTLDNVVDNIKDKYGYNAITRASKLNISDIYKISDK